MMRGLVYRHFAKHCDFPCPRMCVIIITNKACGTNVRACSAKIRGHVRRMAIFIHSDYNTENIFATSSHYETNSPIINCALTLAFGTFRYKHPFRALFKDHLRINVEGIRLFTGLGVSGYPLSR